MVGECIDGSDPVGFWYGGGEIGSVKPGLRPPFRRPTFQRFSKDRVQSVSYMSVLEEDPLCFRSPRGRGWGEDSGVGDEAQGGNKSPWVRPKKTENDEV